MFPTKCSPDYSHPHQQLSANPASDKAPVPTHATPGTEKTDKPDETQRPPPTSPPRGAKQAKRPTVAETPAPLEAKPYGKPLDQHRAHRGIPNEGAEAFPGPANTEGTTGEVQRSPQDGIRKQPLSTNHYDAIAPSIRSQNTGVPDMQFPPGYRARPRKSAQKAPDGHQATTPPPLSGIASNSSALPPQFSPPPPGLDARPTRPLQPSGPRRPPQRKDPG